jgi:tetratricopeptide (TPR) repeat protein
MHSYRECMLPALWRHVDYDDVARFCLEAGKQSVALEACEIGLRLRPGDPLLLVRRAQAYDALGDFDRAIADCEAALALGAPPAAAALAAGLQTLALQSCGRPADALRTARRAIAAAPHALEAHRALGNVLAWNGDLAAAWPELECHWLDERRYVRERFGRAEWNGEDLIGRRVLVAHHQGLGDLIQMARYLPFLRERAAHVTLECPPALMPLLRAFPGVDTLVPKGFVATPDVDVVTRVMALPRLLNERGTMRPNAAPYLRVPPAYSKRWHGLADSGDALRVGLAWAGNPFHKRDRVRSIPLAVCAPWSEIFGIAWSSLQIGPAANDAATAAFQLARFDTRIRDMADTAALIAQLDLVIAVDTAVAHLAGALGKPVWLLLPQRPDWRWPWAGAATHWYPTMRIFRARDVSWTAVVADVAASLRQWTQVPKRICADRV